MHLPPAAEVRAARSLQAEPTLENSDEILHDDMDVEPSRAFLDSDAPNLIVIEPSLPLVQDPKTVGAASASVMSVEIANTPTPVIDWDGSVNQQTDFDWNMVPSPESGLSPQFPAQSLPHVEVANTRTPVIDWVGNINQQTDFDWNMVPSPESGLSPHLLAQSLPYALPNPESSNTTSMLDMPLSQIGEIPDQRSGFEMTQGVLSPRLQHTSGQVPAPVEPSLVPPRPKPAPAPLGPGAILPGPWATLGRRRPKALALSTPNINLRASSPPNIPSAISQPPPTSVNVLKLRAAAEAEAHAVAEIKASLEVSRASIEASVEASKASNSILGSSTLPDQVISLPTRGSPKSSAPADPSPSHPPPTTSGVPISSPTTTNEIQVVSTRGRQRVLTAAGKLLAEEAAKKEADRQERGRKMAALKNAEKVVKGQGTTTNKSTKRATQKNSKKRNK